ncbi:anti-sigma factor domain-containing protein [Belnapia sp. F-4-1]|uniref:anti-sigma factor n=1 Tax=Belnapia sp. F-4-1 TaxID=1545443 RepID=UPI00068D2851|nr:anti-sigma factor [Belnapia sp. F-4-1]
MIPTDPQDRDILAAEYVLGTLDARAVAEVEAALPGDTGLRAAIREWEVRLAPLLALAAPESPPPDLWDRIEAALPGAPRPAPVPRRRWLDPWRGWAIGASAVAAGLAALLVTRPVPEPPRLMTVLLTQRDQPAWVVEANAAGQLRLASLNPRRLEEGRAMQLWGLPPGATAPTSLGLIPPEGQLTVSTGGLRPEPGMLIEISLEPPGGSPTGRPTGPILFIGRLTAAGAS